MGNNLKIFLFLTMFLTFVLTAQRSCLRNVWKGHYGKQLCEVILNLDQWFRTECYLKVKFTDNAL